MKRLACALLAVAAGMAAHAAPPRDGPLAPIDAFFAAFNKGDIAAVISAQRGSTLAIIDEVPPHIWLGRGAVDAWLASLGAYDKAHGRTDGAVAFAKPQVRSVAGDSAYVVAPAVYTFRQRGKPMRESATMTFALHRAASGWKIAGWTWNGTVPQLAAR